jgi:hypothetical protein
MLFDLVYYVSATLLIVSFLQGWDGDSHRNATFNDL